MRCMSLDDEKTAASDRNELLGSLIRRTGIDQMATYGTKQVKGHLEERKLSACRGCRPIPTPHPSHQGTVRVRW